MRKLAFANSDPSPIPMVVSAKRIHSLDTKGSTAAAMLVVGGRMILPIGTQEQHLWMIDKHASGIEKTQLDPVRFVPLLPGAI